MARRVKQADGSYCYTENCRIHDRSLSDSTGLQAVLADSRETKRQTFAGQTSATLQAHMALPEDTANRMGDRIVESVMNNTNGVTAFTVSEAIQDAAREEGAATTNLFSASYDIHTALIQTAFVKQGDEVILNETGERGTITEGNTAFGGAVRFNPENIHSRNSFAWMQPDAVTKIVANEHSPARQQIIATPKDHLIPASLVKQLIDEETSTKTRNAQALREFGKHRKVAKESLRQFGADFEARYQGKNIARSLVLKALNDEYFGAPKEGMSSEEVRATKSGLRNLIAYLDGTM